ncbi:MAG: CRISPR-associated protein Cas4 [Candidatus Aminicenantes bacterium]|nr:CRISPR-associated protein Cas4 [Candidatus Aminicenantes bacterium]
MKIEITVNDIKQFFYCKRVVFFNHVMPVDKKPTYKMEQGRLLEEDLRGLEKRRKLSKYNLENGKRIFSLWMSSEKMGLSGKLDMLIISPKGYFPVEFKYSTNRPQKNHVYQLGGYALLIEEKYGQKVNQGFVYLIPKKEVHVFSITEDLKKEVFITMEAIKTMITAERMPEAAANRSRCQDCEFRNFCGDVF